MQAEPKNRHFGRRTWGAAGLVICSIVALVLWSITGHSDDGLPRIADLAPISVDSDMEARIVAFCGDCHAVPRADSFPRDRWHESVRRGYEFYARSGRDDLDPPAIQFTVNYYRSLAPARFLFPEPEEPGDTPPVRFVKQQVDWPRDGDVQPAISHLRWARLHADRDPVLLVCDMRDGTVAALDLGRGKVDRQVLARLEHPCHVEVCDLDGNGRTDLVVADLGSFFAADHDRGRVVWLRPNDEGEGFEPIVLASGLGRVSDVRPVDLRGDGRLDLLVAEFGDQRTGNTWLLRNIAAAGERPQFEPEAIDSRPGTIHMLPHDFTGNGQLDFAALVSQHYECLDLFINQGDARFRRHPVWAGPDLAFGSSGISLADLNQDGKMDILYTNGDAFDNLYANPAHGIQWLENRGDLDFAYHRLTDLPGAYNARAGDFDRDGSLDIIATAWLPQQVLPVELRTAAVSSLVLLAQTSAGSFVHYTLETGPPRYAALEMGDFDNDGDSDFVVGLHTGLNDSSTASMPPIVIWWNDSASGD